MQYAWIILKPSPHPWFLEKSSSTKLVKVKVAQSCPTLCDPMDYTVHGILQARILEWVVFPPGALPNPGIETRSPALQMESLPAEPKKGGNHCSNGHNSESYTSSPDCFLSFWPLYLTASWTSPFGYVIDNLNIKLFKNKLIICKHTVNLLLFWCFQF